MGILDLMLIISVLVLFGFYLYKKPLKKRWSYYLLTVTLLGLLVQLIFGFVRWQMYGWYFLFLLLFFMVFLTQVKEIIRSHPIRLMVLTVTILVLFLSLATVFAFPVYELPKPTGDYDVGTTTYQIAEPSREEPYNEEEPYRRFKTQVWYPTDQTQGYEKAKWIEDGLVVARSLAKDNGLPSFVLDHIIELESNSYKDAPLSDALATYPVVVISHGWRGFRNLHTDFAEELASHGFVVFSIDHTYGSVAVVFEDDVAYLNLDALPEADTEEEFLNNANLLVNTYAGDVVATLDFIETLHNTSSTIFEGRLDLDNIGLMGHSTGGGADTVVALEDPRVASLLGLDAWVEPIKEETLNTNLNIPSLFLRSGTWETGDNNPNLYRLVEESQVGSYLYQIDGTTHFDFAMVYMYSPLTKYIGFTGSVESAYLTSMLRTMMVDFFEDTLKQGGDGDISMGAWDEVVKVTP